MENKRGNCCSFSANNIKDFFPKSKHSQVTIFIIIAIVIIAAIGILFYFKSDNENKQIPVEFEPVYNSFLYCLEDNAKTGIDLIETQGGYIYLPEFESGSEYMPFSSQLNFLGNPIPYWYYVSGNNIQKEQVPTKTDMENELIKFLEEKIHNCLFDFYYEQGFQIVQGIPTAEVKIYDKKVETILNMDLSISKDDENIFIREHNFIVDSNLGKLYDSARKVYDKEKREMFLEEYGVDILRLYAPVDGVEVTCGPLIWNAEEIFNDLQKAIEINTFALKNKNNIYESYKGQDEYFLVDLDIGEEVNFINSQNWSNSFEVNPTEGNSPLLMAKPVGNQQGLGILGFCYVPYHFVYNVKYPILIQVSSSYTDEIFQFPVGIVINGNLPREALKDAIAIEGQKPELCEYKNTLINVKTYDTSLNPVNAKISYECFGTVCEIGETLRGSLKKEFPQCYNGYIISEAEGYKENKYLVSTNEEKNVEIILDKLYKNKVEIKVNNRNYNGNAIVNFVSEDYSKTISYPEQKTIELTEGQYEIQVYVYESSSINLEETNYEQCMETPKSGIGGLFGLTEEKCFNVNIPSQIISNALIAGGKENYYVLESELKSSNTININADSFGKPEKIEDLQENYVKLEGSDLDINFK